MSELLEFLKSPLFFGIGIGMGICIGFNCRWTMEIIKWIMGKK